MTDRRDLYPLFGVVSIVSTPFDGAGRVDLDALEATVEDRIAAGVSALLAPAVASEVGALDEQERRTLVRFVAECAAGRVPVIAGCSGQQLDETLAATRFAIDRGCAGVLVQAPAPILRDESGLRRHFAAVAATGVPMLMIQDIDWHGPGIPVPIIRTLFEEIEAFRCVKIETVPAGPTYSAVLEATGGRLNVSGGWASTQLIEALDRGVHAFMPSAHHWVYVEIFRLYGAGRRDEARALFERLLPILAFCSQHIDISIRFQKLLAVRQGIFSDASMRAPVVVMDDHHRRLADELLDLALALNAEAGWKIRA